MEDNGLTHTMPTWNPKNPTPQQAESPPPLLSHHHSAANDGKKEAREQGHNGNNDNNEEAVGEVMTGRERLKRHREEVKGRVNIPEDWGQERLLKDWIDYTTFDAIMAPHRLIVSARDALVADGRKAEPRTSPRLRIHTSC